MPSGGGAKVEWGGQKHVWLDETVAASTREPNTTPDDPGFMTWQTAAPPAEERAGAAPKFDAAGCSIFKTRQGDRVQWIQGLHWWRLWRGAQIITRRS